MLGPEWWRQEVGIRGAKAARGIVLVEQVGKVGRGLVMEGFVSEEKDYELDLLWDNGSQWRFWRTGVMWSGRAGVGEQASSRILGVLEFISDFG